MRRIQWMWITSLAYVMTLLPGVASGQGLLWRSTSGNSRSSQDSPYASPYQAQPNSPNRLRTVSSHGAQGHGSPRLRFGGQRSGVWPQGADPCRIGPPQPRTPCPIPNFPIPLPPQPYPVSPYPVSPYPVQPSDPSKKQKPGEQPPIRPDPQSPSPSPTQPTQPTQPTTPSIQPGTGDSSLSPESFAQAPQAGTSAPGQFATNMYGDQFSGGVTMSTIPVAQNVTITAAIATDGSLTLTAPPLPGNDERVLFVTSPQGDLGSIVIGPGGATGNIPVNEFFRSVSLNRATIQALRLGSVVVLDPTQPLTPSNLAAGTTGLQIGNGVATITSDVITNEGNFIAGRADLTYDQVTVIGTPNPSSGGVVGLVSIADDFNPFPVNRFIFNFDYFQNTLITTGGWDVYRYVLGFERTFFDGLASVELRFPFAATLNSDIDFQGESTSTEFGNVRLLMKMLLYQSERFALSGGLAMHFPTADDTRVSRLDGTPLVEFNNEAIVLTPYAGLWFAPTKRLGVQTMLAFNVDPNGNPVFANLDNQGLRRVGRISGPTTILSSTQLSYMMIQNNDPRSAIQSLGPFVEFHYRSMLEEPDLVRVGSFAIGVKQIGRQEMNCSAGVTSRFGNRFIFSAGVVIPLGGEEDRTFDFQAGIRLNVLFGPSVNTQIPPVLF